MNTASAYPKPKHPESYAYRIKLAPREYETLRAARMALGGNRGMNDFLVEMALERANELLAEDFARDFKLKEGREPAPDQGDSKVVEFHTCKSCTWSTECEWFWPVK